MKLLYGVLCILYMACFLRAQNVTVPDVLQPDTEVHHTVSKDHWHFYKFTVPAGQGFSLTVSHSSRHDLDVYVRKGGELPNRFDGYDYKDTTSQSNIKIDGSALPQETVYVVGVYGFKGLEVAYVIKVTFTNGCPSNCNGVGACSKGACSCNKGYVGNACQYSSPEIVLGASTSAVVKQSEWSFYTMVVYTANDLTIDVNQVSGDVDLYVKYLEIPTLLSYDYGAFDRVSTSSRFNLTITQPRLGTWMIGFYGVGTSSFSFKVTDAKTCPMKCSEHGNCVGNSCKCSSDYNGLSCENKRDVLKSNQFVSGYVDENYWNWYRYTSGSMNPFVITLNNTADTNCDLYVKDNAKPSRFIYSYRNMSTDSVSTIVVYEPGFSVWNIGVFGQTSCRYGLIVNDVTASSVCVDCVNGVCTEDGRCVCNSGWSGPNCKTSTNKIQSGVTTAENSLTNGAWAYYEIQTTNTSQLVVVLREKQGKAGMLWLHVASERAPTLTDFDKQDAIATSVHRINMEFTIPASRRFFIGVYGTPFILNDSVKFDLVAWEAPF